MKIGIIGPGRMGLKLAQLWAQQGHEICLASRDPGRGAQLAAECGPGVTSASMAETAATHDILLFSFPWYALVDVQREIGHLRGKIIIDCINPLMSSGSLAVGHKWSAGEEIAQQFPQTKVVKAFNGLYYTTLDQPLYSGQPASLFYCSDDDSAKAVVKQLGQEMGFDPVDCGPLKHARYLEPLATLWIHMAFHLGLGPEMAFKLLPRDLPPAVA